MVRAFFIWLCVSEWACMRSSKQMILISPACGGERRKPCNHSDYGLSSTTLASSFAYAQQAFCDKMRRIPNSVHFPTDVHGEQCSREDWITHHSLPSLIYECCDTANLLEIYTYFNSKPCFIAAKPHRQSKKPRPMPEIGRRCRPLTIVPTQPGARPPCFV
jgi:hypothetical protein